MAVLDEEGERRREKEREGERRREKEREGEKEEEEEKKSSPHVTFSKQNNKAC
jgi:hypothetical protein